MWIEDDSGEDCLYPRPMFIDVSLPREVMDQVFHIA